MGTLYAGFVFSSFAERKTIQKPFIFEPLQGLNNLVEGAGMADDGVVAADLIPDAANIMPEGLDLGQITTDLAEKSGGLGRHHG